MGIPFCSSSLVARRNPQRAQVSLVSMGLSEYVIWVPPGSDIFCVTAIVADGAAEGYRAGD
jgi:hypothetical protein